MQFGAGLAVSVPILNEESAYLIEIDNHDPHGLHLGAGVELLAEYEIVLGGIEEPYADDTFIHEYVDH